MTSDWRRLLSHWLTLGYASRAHPPKKMHPASTKGMIRLPMAALAEVERCDAASGQQRYNSKTIN